MTDVPLFVVVGNVNQGKSSVVAALSENGAIPIDSYPGTTRRSGTYVFRAGGRDLFRIVDTPGFQRPRQALAWLRARASSAAERPVAVRAFVEHHARTGEFPDEVELLRPVLDGAGILYVVDASSRSEPANEAEMEVLRWTGQPAMALVNRVRSRDHTDEWRPILRQYFHIVREFDAHRATFVDRTGLLRGFREIRPEWSASIDAAVSAMEHEWSTRRTRAAAAISDLLVTALSHVEQQALPEGTDEAKVRDALEAAYRDSQRRHETRARDEIERIYGHLEVRRDDPVLELLKEDLFAKSTWMVFGLTKTQLATRGAAWGAASAFLVDLALGGASLGAFALFGGLGGAAVGWFGSQKLAEVWTSSSRLARLLMPKETGRFLAMGPCANPAFAWILLDRALVHCRAVRNRSHARRDALDSEASRVVVQALPAAVRDAIDKAMREVLKCVSKGSGTFAARDALAAALMPALAD